MALVTRLLSGQRAYQASSSPVLTVRLAEADSLAAKGEHEKARTIYQLVSRAGLSLADRDTTNAKAALSASLILAQIYFNQYNDYGRMLESLTDARKIAKKYALQSDGVNFLLGYLYFTIADQNNADYYFDRRRLKINFAV